MCEDLYYGKPPCSRCDKPKAPLTAIEQTAYTLWLMLDAHDRQYWQFDGQPMPLSLETIRGIVQEYALSQEMQGLILTVERIVLQERQKKRAKNKPG